MTDQAAFWRAFFLLHRDLPREGPGSDAATRRALDLLPDLPERPRVLDLGCGPGASSLVLAEVLQCPVKAVDTHPPFLEHLEAEAGRRGLAHLIETQQADMGALDLPKGSVDLIWSEGAVYILGWARGLELWRPLLVPGGCLVASEVSWLRPDPPAELRAFWERGYPAISDVTTNLATARAQGYEPLGHFTLESSAWWDNYLDPLRQRAEALAARAHGNQTLASVLAEQQAETEMCRRYLGYFGYEFYILQKTA